MGMTLEQLQGEVDALRGELADLEQKVRDSGSDVQGSSIAPRIETLPPEETIGTWMLFMQPTLRAYWNSDGSLVLPTVAFDAGSMTLKPTWDWDRAH